MKRKVFTLVELSLIIVIFALVASIILNMQKAVQKKESKTAEKKNVLENKPYTPEPPADYRNNVYYFPQNGREYARALSYFLYHHQSLEVSSSTPDVVNINRVRVVGPDGENNNSAALGHTVTFREKASTGLR